MRPRRESGEHDAVVVAVVREGARVDRVEQRARHGRHGVAAQVEITESNV